MITHSASPFGTHENVPVSPHLLTDSQPRGATTTNRWNKLNAIEWALTIGLNFLKTVFKIFTVSLFQSAHFSLIYSTKMIDLLL